MRRAILFTALALAPAAVQGQPIDYTGQAPRLLGSGHFVGYEHFYLPGWTEDSVSPGGVYAAPRTDEVAAGAFGIGLVWQPGKLGDRPLFLEWNGAVITGSGAVRSTQTYSGNGRLLITGGSAPTSGTINLTTGVGTASGTANITDSTGDTATISSSASSPPGPNYVSQFASSNTASGGTYVALTTDGSGANGAAYGFVADRNGYALIGVGAVDGTSVTSSTNQTILMTTQRFMFSTPIPLGDNGWRVTPRLGPDYRLMLRSVRQQTLVDIDEGAGIGTPQPQIGITHQDNLTAQYFGAVAGVTLSGPIGERLRISVGAEGGLSGYWADYQGRMSAVLPGAGAVILPETLRSIGGLTFTSRLSAGLSYNTPAGFTVSLGGHVDRLEDVPYLTSTTVNAPNASFNAGQTGASYTGNGETYYQTNVATAPMWNAGISISISGRF